MKLCCFSVSMLRELSVMCPRMKWPLVCVKIFSPSESLPIPPDNVVCMLSIQRYIYTASRTSPHYNCICPSLDSFSVRKFTSSCTCTQGLVFCSLRPLFAQLLLSLLSDFIQHKHTVDKID